MATYEIILTLMKGLDYLCGPQKRVPKVVVHFQYPNTFDTLTINSSFFVWWRFSAIQSVLFQTHFGVTLKIHIVELVKIG